MGVALAVSYRLVFVPECVFAYLVTHGADVNEGLADKSGAAPGATIRLIRKYVFKRLSNTWPNFSASSTS
jgi:hypothetical protein